MTQEERDKSFGAVLCAARKRSGLTQRQLADVLNVGRSYICDVEHDFRRALSACQILDVSHALDIHPGPLMAAALLTDRAIKGLDCLARPELLLIGEIVGAFHAGDHGLYGRLSDAMKAHK